MGSWARSPSWYWWPAAGAFGLLVRHVPGAVRSRRSVVAVGLVVLVLPMVRLARPPDEKLVAPGAQLYRAGGGTVLVVDGRIDIGDIMAGLRRTGTGRLDLVVTSADPYLLQALRHRWPVGVVVDPSTAPATRVRVGAVVLDLPGPAHGAETERLTHQVVVSIR